MLSNQPTKNISLNKTFLDEWSKQMLLKMLFAMF